VLHCFSSEIPSARKIAPDTPIVSIPNGIHIGTSARHHDHLPSAPKGDRKSLLFLGRIHPKKGVKELLQAWAKVKEISPDIISSWRLVCAGWDDGGHQDGCELLAKSLGFEASDVTFPGPLYGEAKQDALNGSDAFILPSFSEGLPIAVLEAWAAKLPVFMTQQCNLNEAFQGRSAIEIENAPQSIADVLIRHLADPELASYGLRGAEFVRRSFNWDTIIDQLSEIYSCQIGGGNQCDRSDLNCSSSRTHPTDNPDMSNV
jgi:glycosyltransferase involved in cell wall biosynthesis